MSEIQKMMAIAGRDETGTAKAVKTNAVGELVVDTRVLELLLTALNAKDFATQTTLAAILAKLIAAPATEAKQTALNALVGEVQAVPTANTLLARLKSLEDKIDAITNGTTPAVTQLSGSNVEDTGQLKTPLNRQITIVKDFELLTTPTHDGSGMATHPSVVHIPTEGLGPSGKRWWMVHTPYPSMDITKETPNILCSDDGINWSVPAGVINPIVPIVTGYNADPLLLWDGSKFIMYYRCLNPAANHRITSTNGITWTEPETCSGDMDVTSVIRLSATSWISYQPALNAVWKCVSTDGLTWVRKNIVCRNVPGTIAHLTAYHDASGYHFLLAARPSNIATYMGQLFYGYSKDGNNIQWDNNPIMYPAVGGLASVRVYTSCISPSDRETLRFYVSVYGSQNSRIGYMEVKTTTQQTVPTLYNGGSTEEVVLLDSGVPSGGSYFMPVTTSVLTFEVSGVSDTRDVKFEMAGPKNKYVSQKVKKISDDTYVTNTTTATDLVPETFQVLVPAGWKFRARLETITGASANIYVIGIAEVTHPYL